MVDKLRQSDEISDGLSANQLLRNWPPAFKEWPTRAVRDAVYASPQFPRLLSPDSIRDTIARGVTDGLLGYVGKDGAGGYYPFQFTTPLMPGAIEIGDDMFIITRQNAEAYRQGLQPPPIPTPGEPEGPAAAPESGIVNEPPADYTPGPAPYPPVASPAPTTLPKHLAWSGEVPYLKWMTFYQKVVSRFAGSTPGPKLKVTFEFDQDAGVPNHTIEETKLALRELGLDDDVTAE